MFVGPEEAVECLGDGGVLLFPTETFYALGCLASDPLAVSRVYQLKGRCVQQPLPLVAADMKQIAALTCLDTVARALADAFWPGPLTLLLPVLPGSLPSQLINTRGKVALRLSSHPMVRHLAYLMDGILTASSANLSGESPARFAGEISPVLIRALAESGKSGLLAAQNVTQEPAGGLPSTLVEPLADGSLHILRPGAISMAALSHAGFKIASQ